MLIRTLYFEQATIIAAVVCSLIVAGLLKGIIGVGMPVVALPLLSLFIDIKPAAMLLSMPLIFSNVPQALEGGKTGRCLMQLMPVILGMIPGLVLGVRVLLVVDANDAKIIAGLVLMGRPSCGAPRPRGTRAIMISSNSVASCMWRGAKNI